MPYIKPEFAESVIADADVLSVISKYQDLKKVGANYKCLSPITNEKSPSFTVSPAKNIWKDFSSGEGGGPVQYLMKVEGMTYPEAIECLAADMGREVEYDETPMSEEQVEKVEEKKKLKKIMAWAVEKYHKHFLSLSNDHPAKVEVYENRGYTEEDAKKWKIGYAPGNDFLRKPLKENGSLSEAKDIFLVNDKGDSYVNRVVYPIQRRGGSGYYFAGFGGRALGGAAEVKKYGKWINPKQTPLFDKDFVLFGQEEALAAIHKTKGVILVEGYNDVISCHKAGVENVLASCGTAFTDNQMKLLYKRVKRIFFFIDGDEAGKKAAMKNVKRAIEHGFNVAMLDLFSKEREDGEKLDPHDWAKGLFTKGGHHDELEKLEKEGRNGFLWYAENLFSSLNNTLEKGAAISELCELLACVEDDFSRKMCINELSAQVKGLTKADISKKVAENVQKKAQEAAKGQIKSTSDSSYTMPYGLEDDFAKYEHDISEYKLFQAKNQIFSRRGEEGNYTFQSVSNFSIEIIQHMEDEKFPAKLVKMINVKGKVRIFDTPSDDFTSDNGFLKVCTRRGNYDWRGNRMDFERLTTSLYDKMGEGGMIQVLGWQAEGFWCFNNMVIYNGEALEVDEYGVFKHKGVSYYIPAGNKIYANNASKFLPQKRCTYLENGITFTELSKQLMKVHRSHAMNAILFTLGTYFSDLIYERVSCFPILFLYGEASTGKDNLIEACQSFFGKPQSALTMTGKANTDKAKIRKFAQFRNMMVHMSEYSRGINDVDQMLKSIWDRRGYERGTIDSSVGTESVSIESSLVFTGNEYPDNDALITRIIAEEMNKDTFSQEEKDDYEGLKEMVQEGYSALSAEILAERKHFEKEFRKTYKQVGVDLKDALKELSLADRMIQNAAVLGAVYKLLCRKLQFPFTYEEWKENMVKVYAKQARKRDTGSISAKWWDAFVYLIKNKMEPLNDGYDFNVSGQYLYINYNSCFMRMSKGWFEIYRGAIPSKNIMKDKLVKSEGYVEDLNSHRFGKRKSNAVKFDLNKIGVKEDLLTALESLSDQKSLFPGGGSVENIESNLQNNDGNEEDLPF